MNLGNRERYEDWLEHFRDLVRRGLRTPLTATTDGALGLIKAVKVIWPQAERIYCWVGRSGDVLDKAPEDSTSRLNTFM